MSHLAAVQPAPRAPLELRDVETPKPGPCEILIKNELIALVPLNAKQIKLAIFPVEYPAIHGNSYGGTVAAVGSDVTSFKLGDRVAASKVGDGFQDFGSFATQYVTQAGYQAVTTTSPAHMDFVAMLGAVHVVDHTQPQDAVVKGLVAQGPYDYVVDSISLEPTYDILTQVVAAQGGGKIYTLLPPPESLSVPEGVTTEFGRWSLALAKEKNTELLKWAYGTYFPQAVANDRILALPIQKIDGGDWED
ncbi:chaperonin 10-like protein [Colletotrichum cereale]|nr:chaperonin 10-like protein [Colletotrichum cereale]